MGNVNTLHEKELVGRFVGDTLQLGARWIWEPEPLSEPVF